jgi:hypothetical protein
MTSSQTAPSPPPAPIRLFVIVVAIAVVLTVVIGYLGVSGRLGLGIPGEKPPPAHSSSGQLRAGPTGPRAVEGGAGQALPPAAFPGRSAAPLR